MNSPDKQMLHFVLLPLMAPGHTIPMMDLARLLAMRGVLVSLIITPINLSRIKPAVDHALASGLPIRFVPLPFPCEEVGLPEGCENIDVVPNYELVSNFFHAHSLMHEPLKRYLWEHPPLPSCIVSDMCYPWTRDVADEFGVPRYIFSIICCFTLLCEHNLMHHGGYDGVPNEMEPVLVPNVPHRIELSMAQAPGFFPGEDWKVLLEKVRDAELTSDGTIVNTFAGLDPSYIEGFERAKGKKTWTVGPLSLYNKDTFDMVSRGDQASINVEKCMSWLDSMKPQSVLYASFGSIARTPLLQLVEIGMGLAAAGHPFIWVIRTGLDQYTEVEGWLAKDFEESTKERAIIIRGWAPQMMILSHPSIGGFITHCGWNSSMEGISVGLPMITWPTFGDQFLNERFIVDVLQIGVSIGVKSPAWWGMKCSNVLVRREEVKKAVEQLMDCERDGEERRRRAKELGKMARDAMEVRGSSHKNLTLLIDEVMLHAKKKMEGLTFM